MAETPKIQEKLQRSNEIEKLSTILQTGDKIGEAENRSPSLSQINWTDRHTPL